MAVLEHFIVETLGLTKLPPYLPTFLLSFLGFTLIHLVLAPYLTRRFYPLAFSGKSRLARNNWSIHVVSQVHALIIVPYALWSIWHEPAAQNADRAFGWNPVAGYVHAIATGYFLWDTLDAMYNFIDAGFVAHGLACFLIFTMSFKPFVAYYGTRCLLWETSTIFLNNHWFLDKMNRTGSQLQFVNGSLLLASFFGVRLVYGGSISLQFLVTLREVYNDISLTYTLVYGVGNIILQCLNWFWFYKMINALRKRFNNSSEQDKLLPQDAHGDVEDGTGNGHQED